MSDLLPKRKNTRLSGYKYSGAGVYFLTICTANRERTLSRVFVGAAAIGGPQIALTPLGEVVEAHIERFPGIVKFVIMPNHVHLLVERNETANRELALDVNAFKSLVSKAAGHSVWQRGYYDHIIRNEMDYLNHWQYIEDNPAKWCEDPYYAED